MERESGGIPVYVWVIGGGVIVCGAVGIVACVLMAVLLGFGTNPFGPFVYDLF
jgi:hypothetical protein